MRLRHRIFVGIAASGLVLSLGGFFSFMGHRDNSHPVTVSHQSPLTCLQTDGCHNPVTMGAAGGFVCQAEPSATEDGGWEIIAYHDAEGMNPDGHRVPCP